MAAANDLYSKGNEAFVSEDYKAAVDLYSEAIKLNGTCGDYFAKRSHANLKLQNYKDATSDADKAIDLGDSTANLRLWKGTACFHLKDFESAKDAFNEGLKLADTNEKLIEWVQRCDDKLKGHVKMKSEDGAAAIVTDSDPVPPMPSNLAKNIRFEWYQTDSFVCITVLVKNANKERVKVGFSERGVDWNLNFIDEEPCETKLKLAHRVVPSDCCWKVLHTKIEIKLKKADGLQWATLEASEAKDCLKQFKQESANQQGDKKPKDWDKIVTAISKEEDKDQALNDLFQKIYSDGSDEVKKAMNKSFMESGGTVLSTNWDQVGGQQVEISPPDGMEWKQW